MCWIFFSWIDPHFKKRGFLFCENAPPPPHPSVGVCVCVSVFPCPNSQQVKATESRLALVCDVLRRFVLGHHCVKWVCVHLLLSAPPIPPVTMTSSSSSLSLLQHTSKGRKKLVHSCFGKMLIKKMMFKHHSLVWSWVHYFLMKCEDLCVCVCLSCVPGRGHVLE